MTFSRWSFLLVALSCLHAQAQEHPATQAPVSASTSAHSFTAQLTVEAFTQYLSRPSPLLAISTPHNPLHRMANDVTEDSHSHGHAMALTSTTESAIAAAPAPLPAASTSSTQAPEHSNSLISAAMGLIGLPYQRGGSNAATGFDCSGFVRAIYAQVAGHILPRVAREQAQTTTKIAKNELRPGDLVFFNTMRKAFSHVGIYVGNGQFIHAPRTGASVRVEDMNTSYWRKRFNGARRVPVTPESTPAATALNTHYSLLE